VEEVREMVVEGTCTRMEVVVKEKGEEETCRHKVVVEMGMEVVVICRHKEVVVLEMVVVGICSNMEGLWGHGKVVCNGRVAVGVAHEMVVLGVDSRSVVGLHSKAYHNQQQH
jgi:hypothetical protein